jgi:hypothetical protein
VRLAEEGSREGERFQGSLAAGADHGHEQALSLGSRPGAVAAPDLAIHDRRSHRLLGPVIRGLNRGFDQEPEPLQRVFAEMLGQATIRRSGEVARGQALQFATEQQTLIRQFVATHTMSPPQPPSDKGLVDQFQHRAREAHGATHRRFQQFLATTLQVRQTLLMSSRGEPVVHAPAVMHERARPVGSQQLQGRHPAARRVDHVTGGPAADEGVQPGRAPGHAPTGLVRRHLRRAAHVLPQLLMQRRAVRSIERTLVARATRSSSNMVASNVALLPCDRPNCLLRMASTACTLAPN